MKRKLKQTCRNWAAGDMWRRGRRRQLALSRRRRLMRWVKRGAMPRRSRARRQRPACGDFLPLP